MSEVSPRLSLDSWVAPDRESVPHREVGHGPVRPLAPLVNEIPLLGRQWRQLKHQLGLISQERLHLRPDLGRETWRLGLRGNFEHNIHLGTLWSKPLSSPRVLQQEMEPQNHDTESSTFQLRHDVLAILLAPNGSPEYPMVGKSKMDSQGSCQGPCHST